MLSVRINVCLVPEADISAGLLVATGKRKFAACSLVEGQWPIQAADVSSPRS